MSLKLQFNHLCTKSPFFHSSQFINLLIYLFIYLMHSVHTSPIPVTDNMNANPLNLYLKEPDIIKIYKDRVVLRIYPLIKKDVRASDYYIIVESVDDQFRSIVDRINQSEEIDFSLNYYNSVRNGSNFYAAVHLYDGVFLLGALKFVTVIVGQHQIDLTKPREFRIDDYVNPLLTCGKHYRIGVAAQLEKSKNSKKEFIFVPASRTFIMDDNGSCDPTDTYKLFFALSLLALVISLGAFCLLLLFNVLITGKLCFWKRRKMRCKQPMLKDNLNPNESLTLINHTNIYEEQDYKGDYDEMSIGKTKTKSLKIDSISNPIPISILFDYYNQMNNDHSFAKEFESVFKGKLFNWKIATLKINQKKNRYLELLPYDKNRVVLSKFENEVDFIESGKFNSKGLTKDQLENIHLKPTCYINASWIDVLDNEGRIISKRYIAAQGSLKSTISDFWRMVIQTGACQIVMLANVIEKGKIKCEKYWPDLNRTEIYGCLSCTCKNETVYSDYTIRVIIVEINDDDKLNNNEVIMNGNKQKNKSYEIIQYHFTKWTDHGVPEYSDSVNLLLSSVRSHRSYKQTIECDEFDNDDNNSQRSLNEFELKSRNRNLRPVVVHCSAGIGRSGTYITIDSLLDQAFKVRDRDGDFDNLKLDILKQFANIRMHRVHSIEQSSQYAFVHQILVEMLCSKFVKDLKPKDYVQYYTMLRESAIKMPNELKNITKLEKQFNILNKFRIQLSDEMRSVGLANLKKNRNRKSIPKNTVRVLLPANVVENDYINALYINGFRFSKEFIVTEVPVKEMRHAFWLMIYDQNVDTICLLNAIESHCSYWPTELNVPHVYRELTIELMSEEKTTDYYVKRQFRINKHKTVYQMHFNHWSSICKRPTNIASYCLFMRAVTTHLNKNSMFPSQFVVQCLNGVSASGIYCVSKHIVDRLFLEHQINIFLSTKYIRTNRMEFIEDMEQYNFLFEYIELIIKSFFTKDYNLCFSMH